MTLEIGKKKQLTNALSFLPSENAGNGISETLNLNIFWGSMPPQPPASFERLCTLTFLSMRTLSKSHATLLVLKRVNYPKMDTFVTDTMPPSKRDVRLLESHLKEVRPRQRPPLNVHFSKLSA